MLLNLTTTSAPALLLLLRLDEALGLSNDPIWDFGFSILDLPAGATAITQPPAESPFRPSPAPFFVRLRNPPARAGYAPAVRTTFRISAIRFEKKDLL